MGPAQTLAAVAALGALQSALPAPHHPTPPDPQQLAGEPPLPPIPAPPGSASYSYGLPYTIYYNDAGNLPPNVYDPDNASQYGFVTDAFDPHTAQHTKGTASFSFEGDPMWPNFVSAAASSTSSSNIKEAAAQVYTSGADNASYVTPDCEKAGGVRRDSPLGPVCCARGGCAPQEADLDAIAAMAHKHVTEVVSPDMAGNCVLDWESWQPVVVPDLGYFGYCPGGLSETLPRSDGDWRPRPTPQPFIEGYTLLTNYSLGLVRQRQPHLSDAEALEAAAHEFLSAATAAYVKVLEVAKAARPACHWGYWARTPSAAGTAAAPTRRPRAATPSAASR